MATSWGQATSLEKLDSNSYKVVLQKDWCNGTVPHGGYLVSCFMRAVTSYFQDTLKRNQPHTMTLHVQFARRAQIGVANIVVRDVKLGRRLSTVHVTLFQQGKEVVMGYITCVNSDLAKGMSINTGWDLYPKPYDVDLSKLRDGQDERWVEAYQGLKSHRHVRTFIPSKGQFRTGMVDQWVCTKEANGGSRFTNETLGYIADVFFVEPKFTILRFATLSLSLDVREVIAREGLEWLFMRTTMKQLKKGRVDAEVVIMDATGKLLAVSQHATLVELNQNTTEAETLKEKGKL